MWSSEFFTALIRAMATNRIFHFPAVITALSVRFVAARTQTRIKGFQSPGACAAAHLQSGPRPSTWRPGCTEAFKSARGAGLWAQMDFGTVLRLEDSLGLDLGWYCGLDLDIH